MINLNYKDMDFEELKDTIKKCREELLRRGTITKFCEIHATTKKQMNHQIIEEEE